MKITIEKASEIINLTKGEFEVSYVATDLIPTVDGMILFDDLIKLFINNKTNQLNSKLANKQLLSLLLLEIESIDLSNQLESVKQKIDIATSVDDYKPSVSHIAGEVFAEVFSDILKGNSRSVSSIQTNYKLSYEVAKYIHEQLFQNEIIHRNGVCKDYIEDTSYKTSDHSQKFNINSESKKITKRVKDNILSWLNSGKLQLADLSDKYCNDYEIALSAIKINVQNYNLLSEELKRNEDIILASISRDNNFIDCFPAEVLENTDLFLRLLTYNPAIIIYGPERYRQDAEIMTVAISSKPYLILNVAGNLLANRSYMIEVAKMDLSSLIDIPGDYQHDSKFFYEVLNNHGKNFSTKEELFSDLAYMTKMLQTCGNAIKFCTSEIRNNYNAILAAIQSYPEAYLYASDDIQCNKSIILEMTHYFQYANLVLETIKSNPNLNSDRQFLLMGMKKYADIYSCVCNYLKNDYNFALEAISANCFTIEFMNDNFKSDFTIASKAMDKYHESFVYAGSNIKRSELMKIYNKLIINLGNNFPKK